jgi:hypothetical protein
LRADELQAEYNRRCVITAAPTPELPDVAYVPTPQIPFLPGSAGFEVVPEFGFDPTQPATFSPMPLAPPSGLPGSPLPPAGSGPVFSLIPEGFDFGGGEPVSFVPGTTPIVAPVSAQAPAGPVDECQLGLQGGLPQDYSDRYGPMTVLRVVCGAPKGVGGGGIDEVGAQDPIVQGEVETLSGLAYIGLARSLG